MVDDAYNSGFHMPIIIKLQKNTENHLNLIVSSAIIN